MRNGVVAEKGFMRLATALSCVGLVAGLCAAPARAADLGLSEQFIHELNLSETALRNAANEFWTADLAAQNLREQIRRCEEKVRKALQDLRDHGGENPATGISEAPNINQQIDLAHTLAQAAERGNNPYLNVTTAMAPYLKALEDALRALRDKQQQLTQVQQRVNAASKALGEAREKLEQVQANPEYAALPGDKPLEGEGIQIRRLVIIDPQALQQLDGTIRIEVPPRQEPTHVVPQDTGGIRYYTPRFSGFQLGQTYVPTDQETATDAKTDDATQWRIGIQSNYELQVEGGIGLKYSLGQWEPKVGITLPEKPADSGAERTSQAEAAALTGPSAQLGDLAYPSDRFFNRRSSWGQDFDDQWALKRIGFETVRDVDAGDGLWPVRGHPVVVAVLDTGIDRGHPELTGTIRVNRREVLGNKVDDDRNGFVDDTFGWNFVADNFDTWDDNGHGTFVAGIIAARTDNGLGIAGVNPYARLLPVKVTDHQHGSGSKLIAKGIRYAVDRGARIINISIGGPGLTAEEEEAVRYAISKDALIVVAAGNLGVDTANFGPAGTGGVITVAATDRSDQRAKFSNFGRAVDIAAPGVDILSLRAINTDMIAKADKNYKPGSAFVGGVQDYYVASGTSFAAPLVSGVASLLLSKNPKLTGAQVRRMILQSAKDIDVPGVDQNTGYGLLDARGALNADPSFFIEALISGVSVVGSGSARAVRVSGTADADKFAGAHIELGAGDAPSEWKKVSDDIGAAVQSGRLADIAVGNFRGSKRWTIRVIVRHAGGKQREGRFVLNLG